MRNVYFRSAIFSTLLVAGLSNLSAQNARDTKRIKIEQSAKASLDMAPDLIRKQLKLSDKDKLIKIKSESDDIGFTHEKYQQVFSGIKVEFGTYSAHSKNNQLKTLTGELYDVGKVNTRPTISEDAAFDLAVNHINAEKYLWEDEEAARNLGNYTKPEGELVILPKEVIGTGTSRLAYKFDIYALQPLSRGDLYIDAHTGEALFYNAIIKHLDEHAHAKSNLGSVSTDMVVKIAHTLATGNAATRYSGTRNITTRSTSGSYILNDNTRGYGINTYNSQRTNSYSKVNFSDGDNNWSASEYDNYYKDNAALDAHWGAEMTYDYFSQKHNRNSYNNSGAAINSFVHYKQQPSGGGYDNAFWNGQVMTYGDGSSNGNEGNGYFDALTSIDVAAHEIGHAVCTHTANLVYNREAGGMNEGFSDIWGASVEHFAKGNGNDYAPSAQVWLIGDEIDRRNGSSALRSMSNPNERGQPDTYGGSYWVNPNCGTPTDSNDYCGVHTNSGVLNYWFYLLTVGGSGTNDIGSSFNVDGIGMTKAAKIAYRLEANYLSANSTYADAREGAILAAEDLYGANSNELIAVTKAWYAVGVGSDYVENCSLAAPSNLSSSNIEDNGFTISWSSVYGASSYTVELGNNSYVVYSTTKVFSGLNTATEYLVTVTANCSSGSGASSSIYVTTSGTPSLDYCNSTGNSVADEYIQRVQLGSIDNASNGGNGYSDFTSISTELVKGSDNTITITPKWTGTQYNEGYGVWIDFNHDGDFSDSGEFVYSKSPSKVSPIQGVITVPYGAAQGATRMRVILKYNATPSACESSFDYGEVEDYTVTIVADQGDYIAPSAPSNLEASNVTQTSVSLDWNTSTDNVGVVGYDVYVDGNIVGSTTSNSASLSSLTPATTYVVKVKAKDEAGNESGFSNSVSFTTLSSQLSYCETKGSNSSYEWIDKVVLADLYNVTGNDGGYADFTNLSANLGKGNGYTMVVSAGYRSSTYLEYWAVWIDFNQNGTFENSEQVVTGSSSNGGDLSKSFTVPSYALSGATRMRVSMKYNASQTACETFSYGEVEDYTVNISNSGVTAINGNSQFANATELGNEVNEGMTISPNPAKDFVKVALSSRPEQITYRIVTLNGQLVAQGELLSGSIDVSNLKAGVYVIQLNDGQKDFSEKLIKK